MINNILKYLKYLDYKYINFIKEIKFLFNEAFLVFYVYRIIKMYLPYFLYKINRKIEIIIYQNIYLILYKKYKKINYTIFNYPKHFNNFNFFDYIKKNMKNDFDNIFDYYSNIFNIYKWKYNIFLFIILIWFYSILLISNNLLYFFMLKFIFYSLKYFLKYFIIIIDYILYTYLNFTRMPKIFVGLPYMIIMKTIYSFYHFIFYILPLLIFINYWWTIYYDFKSIVVKKINCILDIIEFVFFAISRSYIIFILKKWLYYIKYYLTEEDKLSELIDIKKNKIKIYYKYIIKYNTFLFINFRIIYYILYIIKYFIKIKDIFKRTKELYIYLLYMYPYIYFHVKFKLINLLYIYNLYRLHIDYKFINLKYIFENKKDSLYLYNKYTIYYNIIIFLLKILNNININIILIYNINLILFSYFNPFKKLK